MLFVRKAALRPVPRHAVIEERVVVELEEQLDDDSALQELLDSAFRDMDRVQPVLSRWLAEKVSSPSDDLAQSLGYFLVVTVYLAFRDAFPSRLAVVDETALSLAQATFDADEELRRNDPTEVLETDDVVAIQQPALLQFVQHHLDQAVEQSGPSPDLPAFDLIYRSVLVEVIALSHAVAPSSGDLPQGEIFA